MAIWLLLGARNRRGAMLRLLWLGAGAAAGFLLLWGWWGLMLWRHFHNPFFPMFGRLFPSPWSLDLAMRDPRFFPRSILQWIAYPVLLARRALPSSSPSNPCATRVLPWPMSR